MPEGQQVSMDTMAVEITEIDGEGEYLTTATGETYLVQTDEQLGGMSDKVYTYSKTPVWKVVLLMKQCNKIMDTYVKGISK